MMIWPIDHGPRSVNFCHIEDKRYYVTNFHTGSETVLRVSGWLAFIFQFYEFVALALFIMTLNTLICE
jgi:hypothetical protein